MPLQMCSPAYPRAACLKLCMASLACCPSVSVLFRLPRSWSTSNQAQVRFLIRVRTGRARGRGGSSWLGIRVLEVGMVDAGEVRVRARIAASASCLYPVITASSSCTRECSRSMASFLSRIRSSATWGGMGRWVDEGDGEGVMTVGGTLKERWKGVNGVGQGRVRVGLQVG